MSPNYPLSPNYPPSNAGWDGNFGESLGIPTSIPQGNFGLGMALGLPSQGCEFGPCGSGSNSFGPGAGAIAGTIACQFAEPCGAIEDVALIVGAAGVLGYDVWQMSQHGRGNQADTGIEN